MAGIVGVFIRFGSFSVLLPIGLTIPSTVMKASIKQGDQNLRREASYFNQRNPLFDYFLKKALVRPERKEI